MKPARFQYCAPAMLDEALTILAQCGPDAKILAGGQSLIPLLNMRLAAPLYLLDINRISTLDYIEARSDYLAVGAVTRQRTVEQSALVREQHPLIVDAMRYIGHMQIRNRGTVAGSIAHADPAAELPALLTCLNGEVVVRSHTGERIIKAQDFFIDYLMTALEPEELLTEVRFPWLPAHAGWSYMELARRAGDYALAGVVAVVTSTVAGICSSAQLCYLGIAGSPMRSPAVEHILVGSRLDEKTLHAAAEAATQLVSDDFSDIHATSAYRRSLTMEITKRALRKAWMRCRQL